jgi:Peptidase family S41
VLRYRTPSGQLVSKSLPRSWQTFEVVCEAPHRAVEMLAPGVWYVDLNQASDNELQVHEQAFMTAKALIFDARKYIRTDFRYLGHFSATTLLGPRTDIPLIRLPDGVGWQWDRMQMHIAPLAPRIATRTIYLVGGQTMSRAETYLQFVKYYGLGTIIGEPTAGTSGDVSSIALPGGYQAFWTGVRFQTQDGARFHGVGIVPDVTLIPTLAQRLQGGDTLLTAALQMIGAPDQPQ